MIFKRRIKNFRRWLEAKIWYYKALRKAKKMYPKGTKLRWNRIWCEIHFMRWAENEKEIERLWGNKKPAPEPVKMHENGLIY